MNIEKLSTSWYSHKLGQELLVARWGHYGQPLILFPTAGGDAEECERFLMIKVLAPLIEAGRLKVYSCDSLSGQAWINREAPGAHKSKTQLLFDRFIIEELMPVIRKDCGGYKGKFFVSGASIGAYNAMSVATRNPEHFSAAICMSGTYDLESKMNGNIDMDFYFTSPMHFLPNIKESPVLNALREVRFIILCGLGRWESPEESKRIGDILRSKGVPTQMDFWGDDCDHDWPTWRRWLPLYLDKLLPAAE